MSKLILLNGISTN